MSRMIHARLDVETEKLLTQLERRLGWSDSKIVREGIKRLEILLAPKGRRRIAGTGRFRSGMPDLGSTKAYLKGFGS